MFDYFTSGDSPTKSLYIYIFMTIASPITLTFIQGYKCISNYFWICNILDNI